MRLALCQYEMTEGWIEMKGVKNVRSGDIKVGDIVVDPLGYGQRVVKITRSVSFEYENGEGFCTDPEWLEQIAIDPEQWGAEEEEGDV